MTDIFQKRIEFKPYEYSEILAYKDAIQHSYWLVSEWNFVSDIQDFNVKLSPEERNAIKNTLLAISQIEVAVKKFWANIGNRFPKSEFDQVGIVFGESEVRHADAYSHLLQILGLNDDFKQLLNVPAIKGRVDYLSKYITNTSNISNKEYTIVLSLFSIFVENISLFSQFAIIKSLNKYKNCLKDIDNVVQATMKEELTHALFGIKIINIIKSENPEWFNEEFYEIIKDACLKSYEAESNIIDWIFENGEFEFLSKDSIKEFVKNRFNESIKLIGGKNIFKVDTKLLKNLKWFEDEIYAESNTDFFNKKPVTYTKFTKAFTEGDLFDD